MHGAHSRLHIQAITLRFTRYSHMVFRVISRLCGSLQYDKLSTFVKSQTELHLKEFFHSRYHIFIHTCSKMQVQILQ